MPREYTRTPIEERFWTKVDMSGDCWHWIAARTSGGYGTIDNRYAHRVSWEIAHGPIPDGLLVCHHCDIPVCVNPAHLFLGTTADNMRDRDAKGRGAIGERDGNAKLTQEAVITIRRQLAEGLKQKDITARFGVSRQIISAISVGTNWSHVN